MSTENDIGDPQTRRLATAAERILVQVMKRTHYTSATRDRLVDELRRCVRIEISYLTKDTPRK